ncbi:MAG: Cellulophaga phage phi46:3 [Bacteroidota bacterium]|jgi:integrase
MATINFRIKATSASSTIYLRFRDSNYFDLEVKTGLIINSKYWDKSKQRIRNVIDVPNRVEINEKLSRLCLSIFDAYNADFATGEVIDKNWLLKNVSVFFNRPQKLESGKTDNTTTFFSDFAQNWIDSKSTTFKVSANKYMDKKTASHYQQCLNNFKEFEGKNKVKLVDLNNLILDSFSHYLSIKQGYSESTAKRKVGRIKFFCLRAESDNLPINKQFKERVFVQEQEIEYKQPYLNEDEINAIFKFKLEPNCPMDHVRDNLIIGLWSSLRVSDFLTRLNVSNIEDGFIKIKTMKTKTFVNIPIHWQVKSILEKRNGRLPEKISEQKFNDNIKILARIVGIDDLMVGGVVKVDKKTKVKRKVIGTYKKWELITSHVGRRSFCTNLFGKVDDSVIMSVAGWKSKDQMYAYNKQTNMESAKILKDYWDKKYT